jgi:acetolactate synthase-1/3 small subunit
MRRQILGCLVENRSGVLTHITGLFASRGYNIDSLTVGETENPRFSRITIVCRGDEKILEQIRKQLSKIIDVVKVINLSETESVQRELALIRLNVPPAKRAEVMEISEVFRGKVVDVGAKELMIELSGKNAKVEAFIDLMRPYGIKELARTGEVALARGPRSASVGE